MKFFVTCIVPTFNKHGGDIIKSTFGIDWCPDEINSWEATDSTLSAGTTNEIQSECAGFFSYVKKEINRIKSSQVAHFVVLGTKIIVQNKTSV